MLGISGEGRGDTALLNAMSCQASAVGNPKLDRGTAAFVQMIASEQGDGFYPDANSPYLSTNLVFEDAESLEPLVLEDGQEAFLAAGSLAGSAVITVGGERFGIVGATTPSLSSITSTGRITVLPEDSAAIAELAAIIQESVDDLPPRVSTRSSCWPTCS